MARATSPDCACGNPRSSPSRRKCPSCTREKQQLWYAANRERVLEQAKLPAMKAKAKERRAARMGTAEGKMHLRCVQAASTYRISYDAARELYASDICGICGERGNGQKMVIDHCHVTDRVRGLLCHGCNVTLGFVEKRRPYLAKMLAWMDGRKEHGPRKP